MGMYKELHFNVELKKDTPDTVTNVLKHMLGGRQEDPYAPPKHEFFKTSRWNWMFNSDSFYFKADTHSTMRYCQTSNAYYLCLRFNVKNYDGEIEKFLDWIMPYVDAFDGDFFGFFRYEESDAPTLIHFKTRKKVSDFGKE